MLINIIKSHQRAYFQPLVCFLHPGPLVEKIAAMDCEVFVLPAPRLRQLATTARTVLNLAKLIGDKKIDLVHSSMAWSHIFAGSAALLTHTPAVWYQHARADGRTLIDILSGLVPAHTVYVNSLATKQAQDAVYTAASEIKLLYCGIDLEHWSLDAAAGQRLRQEFAIPATAPLVVMPGRLQRWKGQHIFIYAAAKVLKQLPNTYFLIVGDTLFSLEPEYKQQLYQQVAQLGLSAQVLFAGMRQDMQAVYSAADIIVHASLVAEPFGLTVAEAMAMGKAVIASAAGGPAEIIVADESGCLIPPNNSDLLAQKMLLLLQDHALHQRLAIAAQQRVHTHFSLKQMITQLEQDYIDILIRSFN
jgi:glycosyltransferase involved in cell wall biosynthesis